MKHLCGRKKKSARRAVDKARQKMEEELYKKLDEDGGKRMIYKMTRDRNEESKDVKRGSVIKDKNGTLNRPQCSAACMGNLFQRTAE